MPDAPPPPGSSGGDPPPPPPDAAPIPDAGAAPPDAAVPAYLPVPGIGQPPLGDAVAAPPPPRRRRYPAWAVILAVIVVAAAVAIVASQLSRHNSRFTIIDSASTDNTFHGGDCVILNPSSVDKADCSANHDGQIIVVIHAVGTCPAGTDEYDVRDNTGNLCVDRSSNKH